jgi:hypothetical protein
VHRALNRALAGNAALAVELVVTSAAAERPAGTVYGLGELLAAGGSGVANDRLSSAMLQ